MGPGLSALPIGMSDRGQFYLAACMWHGLGPCLPGIPLLSRRVSSSQSTVLGSHKAESLVIDQTWSWGRLAPVGPTYWPGQEAMGDAEAGM